MDEIENAKVCVNKEDSIFCSKIQIVNIPKIIIRISGKNDYDRLNLLKKEVNNINPNWRYYCYAEEDEYDFVYNNFPKYLDTYKKCNQSTQRQNMLSYMLLYKFGGVYINKDYKIIKSLDNLFYSDADIYINRDSNSNFIYGNILIASRPELQIWLDVLDDFKSQFENKKWFSTVEEFDILNKIINNTKYPYMVLPSNLIKYEKNNSDIYNINIENHYLCLDDRRYNIKNDEDYFLFTNKMEINTFLNKNPWILFFIGVFFFIIMIWIIYILFFKKNKHKKNYSKKKLYQSFNRQPALITQNQQQPALINQNQQQPVLINQNQQQPSLINQNQQQPALINQNQQQPALINQNQQQPLQQSVLMNQPQMMISPNYQQPMMISPNYQQPMMISPSYQQENVKLKTKCECHSKIKS